MPFGLDTQTGERLALEATEEERRAEYEARWEHGGLPFLGGFADLLLVREANDTAAEFVRDKIREIVRDPRVAALLSPRPGARLQAPVHRHRLLRDLQPAERHAGRRLRESPIEAITPRGLRTRDAEYALDSIVFATGFDAMTGALLAHRHPRRGRRAAARRSGPRGRAPTSALATAGFPNLFMITGPGSPSVLSNMVPSIEQHVDWIARCIGCAARAAPRAHRGDARGRGRLGRARQRGGRARRSSRPATPGTSGANVPGKPRVFMPYLGFPAYVQKCDEVAAKGYEGFAASL